MTAASTGFLQLELKKKSTISRKCIIEVDLDNGIIIDMEKNCNILYVRSPSKDIKKEPKAFGFFFK